MKLGLIISGAMDSLPEDASVDFGDLYNYWLEIAPHGRLPGRQHFDPLDVPKFLPNLWLTEVHRKPFRFWYRLAGSKIEEHAGESLTGNWFAQRLGGENLRRAQENLEHVVTTRQANWRRGRPFVRWEREYIELERLYLPLARDGENVDMILAMTIFSRMSFDKIPLREKRAQIRHRAFGDRGRSIVRRWMGTLAPQPVSAFS